MSSYSTFARSSMNVQSATGQVFSHISSRRFFVHKRNIIDSSVFSSSLFTILIDREILSSFNQNCCGKEEKKIQVPLKKVKSLPKIKEKITAKPDELIVEVPKQTKLSEVVSNEKRPLLDDILSNSWPLSNERVENVMITQKRCYFSNEAVSIKPITAVPGIGDKYGQILADHGFIYARQLLGYYMILKDSEMFRKWLEYQFHIPKFRAAEITSALNELIRRTF